LDGLFWAKTALPSKSTSATPQNAVAVDFISDILDIPYD